MTQLRSMAEQILNWRSTERGNAKASLDRLQQMQYLIAAPAGLAGDALQDVVRVAAGKARVHRVRDYRALNQPDMLRRVWGLIVLDLGLTDLRDEEMLGAVAQRFPDSPLVAVGASEDEAYMQRVLDLGFHGYLPTSYGQDLALSVLRLVLGGSIFRPRRKNARVVFGALASLPAEPEETFGDYGLTPREIEVLSHLALGRNNGEISHRLDLQTSTVRVHVSSILHKMGVNCRGEAQLLAQRLQRVSATQLRAAENGELQLDWLLPHMRHRHCDTGTVLFRAGDAGDELYYIQRGAVGLQEIDVVLHAGELFGEISIFAPHRSRTCTAICTEPTELFSIDDEKVRHLQNMNPQFGALLMHLLAQRLSADLERGQPTAEGSPA